MSKKVWRNEIGFFRIVIIFIVLKLISDNFRSDRGAEAAKHVFVL